MSPRFLLCAVSSRDGFATRNLHRCDELITQLGNGPNVDGRRWIVAQSRANLRDAEVQAAFKLDMGCIPPDGLAQLVARDNAIAMFQQTREHSRWLRLQVQQRAMAEQRLLSCIELKQAKAITRRWHHGNIVSLSVALNASSAASISCSLMGVETAHSHRGATKIPRFRSSR